MRRASPPAKKKRPAAQITTPTMLVSKAPKVSRSHHLHSIAAHGSVTAILLTAANLLCLLKVPSACPPLATEVTRLLLDTDSETTSTIDIASYRCWHPVYACPMAEGSFCDHARTLNDMTHDGISACEVCESPDNDNHSDTATTCSLAPSAPLPWYRQGCGHQCPHDTCTAHVSPSLKPTQPTDALTEAGTCMAHIVFDALLSLKTKQHAQNCMYVLGVAWTQRAQGKPLHDSDAQGSSVSKLGAR